MLSGSRTPEFVAGVLPLGFSIEIPKKIQKGTLLQGQIMWFGMLRAPLNQWRKKRCPDPHPICTGKVTEALAKPRQASASPGFVLPFLSFVMAKMVPTWIAWADEASGETHDNFPRSECCSLEPKPPLSLLHCRSQSRVAQYSFQSGPGGLASKSAWDARQSTIDNCSKESDVA
jgi:hypothetical protein